ncbi:hypothetical protein HUF15_00755 [Streptomyces samsunensis]|uniref:hypothetical protein n=1 Tax=Streptomyces malaysiensis TaxID=92644 RepID=UPI001583D732|nr:hypothetical protein [Streptomyces samsunensis]NUH35311.1 hypothetical protein [Streptomyces samsunensis]
MITILLGVLLGSAFIWGLCLVRTAGARRAPRPGAFGAAPEGTCWHACHDVACGHMTTRWIPTPDGGRRCEHAARHRGPIHLTRTTEEGRDA